MNVGGMDVDMVMVEGKVILSKQENGSWVKKITVSDKTQGFQLVEKLKDQLAVGDGLNDEEKKRIRLYTSVTQDSYGYVCLSRPYLTGVPLEEQLKNKNGDRAWSIGIMLRIAEIINVAHGKEIYHGDLTPSNVLCGDHDELAIVDWLPQALHNYMAQCSTDDVPGTPEYMPVEQLQATTVTPLCDVYACGILLHKLLSGNTPFDSFHTNEKSNAIQWVRYKMQNPQKLDGTLLPSEAKLVEDAIKGRIKSMDEFINRLKKVNNQQKVSNSSVAPTKEARLNDNPASKAKEKSLPQGKAHKLVLIGHTGSGKTVLGAGLYATRDENFNVMATGTKSATGVHFINAKSAIENGKWPAATSKGEIINLDFKINFKGGQETISFDEYAGERLQRTDYETTIVKNPDGALMTINPGAPQWHENRAKNELLEDMKHYVEILGKKPNNPPIALVITASDRLDNDLADFKLKFLEYVKEIELALKNVKNDYKIFYVSISGKLDDQSKPVMNPQGIQEPFMWMLERFAINQRNKMLRCLSIWTSAMLLLFLTALWAVRIYDNAKTTRAFKDYEQLASEHLKSNEETQKYLDEFVKLRNRWCKEEHFTNNGKKGTCSALCEENNPIFSKNEKKIEEICNKIEERIDECKVIILGRDLEKALANATEGNRKVKEDIEGWQPLLEEGKSQKAHLVERCKKELLPRVFEYDCQKLNEKISGMGVDISGIALVVKAFYDFKDKPMEGVDPAKSIERINMLEELLLQRLENAIIEMDKTAQVSQMQERKYVEPPYYKKLDSSVLWRLPSPYRKRFADMVEKFVEVGKNKWLEEKNKVIDGFIEKNAYRNLDSLLGEAKEFIMENCDNPSFDRFKHFLEKKIREELDKIYEKFVHNKKEDYLELKRFAGGIINCSDGLIPNSKVLKFATLFVEMMNEKKGVTVTDIRVKSSFGEGAYIENVYLMAGDKWIRLVGDLSSSEEDKAVFYQEEKRLPFWKPCSYIKVELWDKVVFKFDVWQNIEFLPDKKIGNKSFIIPVEKLVQEKYSTEILDRNYEKVEMTFHMSINFKTLDQIWKESFSD